MKYSERLGDRKGVARGYHTAIVTSFAIEFAGFEEIMLPQLGAAGATNVILVADPGMTAMALSEGTVPPMCLGREYIMHGPLHSPGVFHPKITLQLGRDGGRAFVSSANATAAGIGGNVEIITEVACESSSSPERSFIRAVWDYLVSVTTEADGAVTEGMRWAYEKAPWLAEAEPADVVSLEDGTLLGLLYHPNTLSIAEQFCSQIEGEVTRLIVLSPYWDHDLGALVDLNDRLGNPSTLVMLDVGLHDFPRDVAIPPKTTLINIADWNFGRFKHAKLLIAQTATHDYVLSGSTNCTKPALGTRSVTGSNAEASVFRRVASQASVKALGLQTLLDSPGVAQGDLPALKRSPPLPLDKMRALLPGTFEIEHEQLRWTPKGKNWSGHIVLLDIDLSEVARIQVSDMQPLGQAFTIQIDAKWDIRFALVDKDGAVSVMAAVVDRKVIRRNRREAQSQAASDATAKFVSQDNIELFLLQALEVLDRADAAENYKIARAGKRQQKSRADDGNVEREVRSLSYAEFTKEKPETRNALGGNSSIAGSNVDVVRELLNKLSGGLGTRPHGSQSDSDTDTDFEDEEQDDVALTRDKAEKTALARPAIDHKAFASSVATYISGLATFDEEHAVGGHDVLKLRFWLLLILHAAKWNGFRGGLLCNVSETGWPRLVIKILYSFFGGPKAPVLELRLVEQTDIPVDFLETWATALWVLDLIEAVLNGANGAEQFLSYVRALKFRMLERMALTPAEANGEVMLGVRNGLEAAIGKRLKFAATAAGKAEAKATRPKFGGR